MELHTTRTRNCNFSSIWLLQYQKDDDDTTHDKKVFQTQHKKNKPWDLTIIELQRVVLTGEKFEKLQLAR